MAAPLPRLAVILSHPTQYYSPWFIWLGAHTPLPFRVFYLWDFGVRDTRDPQFGTTFRWDRDLLSGYESEFVPNTAADPGTHHWRGLSNPALPDRLAAWRPECLLLFGYKWSAHLRALAWARRHRVPVLFRGDSHFLGRGAPPLIRRLLLRLLYRQFAGITYVGQANRDYFRLLGVREEQLFFAPHSVDQTLFDPANPTVQAAAAALRTEHGLAGKRVVLFAGKMSERKQPVPLLRAFLQVATENDALVFVGEGDERGALESLARAHPDRRVRFLPFANQTEMPARYLLADFFALPSHGFYETWGLAVNEAMHMGVPCLVSDLVGCQRDLVRPGETGWVFEAGNLSALAQALQAALRTPPEELARLRSKVIATISRYTYEQTAAGLLQALAHLSSR
ncbi:MAG: glycosyltransferase family 4 protein [Opitutaceae bacterium]|nr:glycosyltransferase family 4 protein [Opitutaceae bacterium]